MKISPIAFSMMLVLAFTVHAQANEEQNDVFLNKKQITTTLSGKRIYLKIPLGGEFPLNYYQDQMIDGNGETTGLGFLFKQRDSGTWWVEQNKICQQWTSWYDNKAHCFKLKRIDRYSLYWIRDDGLEGTARIGETVSR